jgi:hypothetical protein
MAYSQPKMEILMPTTKRCGDGLSGLLRKLPGRVLRRVP